MLIEPWGMFTFSLLTLPGNWISASHLPFKLRVSPLRLIPHQGEFPTSSAFALDCVLSSFPDFAQNASFSLEESDSNEKHLQEIEGYRVTAWSMLSSKQIGGGQVEVHLRQTFTMRNTMVWLLSIRFMCWKFNLQIPMSFGSIIIRRWAE